MPTLSYLERRSELETYFDQTAVEAWDRLTSDAPLSRIRATVREGREMMRRTLLSWLPADLNGRRVLDAGCGTGALATEAARRGADVLAIDLSPTLIGLARNRAVMGGGKGHVEFRVGDMLDPGLGRFDHIVAMDSLIHYRATDMVKVLTYLAPRSEDGVIFTFAPRTPALALMHLIGRAFPRKDRAPAIEPISAAALGAAIAADPGLAAWQQRRTRRIVNGFYTSQGLELAPG